MNQKNNTSRFWGHGLSNWKRRPSTWVLLLWIGMGMMTFSCHPKVYFTNSAREKLEEAGDNIAMLQFYNDKEILLRRKTTSREVLSDEGLVVNTEGIRVMDLRIRRRTPCRIDSIAGNRIYIRFEDGDGNHLVFYKNTYDHYQIYSDEWVSGRGNVKYNMKDFAIERIGNDCLLMVQNNSKYRRLTDRKVVEGLRVDPYQSNEDEEDEYEEDEYEEENPSENNEDNNGPTPKQ